MRQVSYTHPISYHMLEAAKFPYLKACLEEAVIAIALAGGVAIHFACEPWDEHTTLLRVWGWDTGTVHTMAESLQKAGLSMLSGGWI